jgi:hypothetical protein
MISDYNRHYIRINDSGYIIKGFSDAYEAPEDTDICINEQGGRQFEILGIVTTSMANRESCYLFKYENGEVRKATEAEIQEQRAAIPPSPPDEITMLKEQLTQARSDAILALNANTYLYEMILAMQTPTP